MRAFGPEETSASEEIDIIRLMDTVTRSVRFYAKRGLNISVERPPDAIPSVRAKSHTLIRSLFLVFVELFDAAADSGIELSVKLSLHHEQAWVTLTLMVSAGPFSLPTVLLAQLEKGGAMMRHIVEAGGTLTHVLDHQGNLSVSISLPVADEGRRSSLPPHKQKISRRGTILIAEDEAAVIRSLRRVLERNHDILAVRTGEEAIELLKDTPQIEVVIYDVSMPRVPGPVFFEEIKRFNSLIAEKIVFVRGGAYDTEITEFLARTENPVVDKPFDLPKLSDVISLLLQPE
jgi:CheY-like chemotaxis protein